METRSNHLISVGPQRGTGRDPEQLYSQVPVDHQCRSALPKCRVYHHSLFWMLHEPLRRATIMNVVAFIKPCVLN